MWERIKNVYGANKLSVDTIAGVLGGLTLGLIVKQFWLPEVDYQTIRYVSLPGAIYIQVFYLLIVPLIILSLSTSFISNKRELGEHEVEAESNYSSRKLILITLLFFAVFSSFTATFGVTLVALLKPGSANEIVSENASEDTVEKLKEQTMLSVQRADMVYNVLMNIFPDNFLTPAFMIPYVKTNVVWPANLSSIEEPGWSPLLRSESGNTFKPNLMGLCVMSLMFGSILSRMGRQKTEGIRKLLLECDAVVKYILAILVRLMPMGMFCWMFTEALKMNSMGMMVEKLAYFYLIIISAFVFIWFIFYPLVYLLFAKQNVFRLYGQIIPAMMVSFGSSSSAITLPTTMECMERKAGLSSRISQIVLPLGMTIHMNGPAMYYPMVALFVAQVKQVPVDPFSLIVICLFSVIMSMGFPPTPGGGTAFINHMAFASVIGVDNPQDILAYIIPFEWIMIRIRTSTNVIGDCVASKCIEKTLERRSK